MKVDHSQLFFWELKKTLQAKNTKYNPIEKKKQHKNTFLHNRKTLLFFFELKALWMYYFCSNLALKKTAIFFLTLPLYKHFNN